jgi:hypothetical protein
VEVKAITDKAGGARLQGIWIVLGALWVLFIVSGFSILKQEAFTPVPGGASPAFFPVSSGLPLDRNKATLVFFAHPHCPCTRASLHELEAILAETGNNVSVVMVFAIPDGVPAGWEKGDLWNRAAALPGLHLFSDTGGREARGFGITGSGHVLLYEPGGKLIFSGGITPSRGHEGENPGRSAIVRYVLQGDSRVGHTPVFGCSLL